LRRRDRVRHRRQRRCLDDVEEREPHLYAPVGLWAHRSDHDGIRPTRPKLGKLHVLGATGPGHDPGVAHLPEEAASLQIGGDDAGDAERPGRFVLEWNDRDGDRGAGSADDFDGELRARRRDGKDHEREGGKNQAMQCGPWQEEAAFRL
jgi:hypothetical protein